MGGPPMGPDPPVFFFYTIPKTCLVHEGGGPLSFFLHDPKNVLCSC
jgi:hypothetical protein